MSAQALHEDQGRPRSSRAKVCFVGEREVGKTSLIRRYVQDSFDETYVATLGARVTKVYAIAEDGDPTVELILWDVMGAPGFRELLQEAYFHGAQGVMAVCDLTRRTSLWQLSTWLKSVDSIASPGARIVVGNKADLVRDRQVNGDELRTFAATLNCLAFEASAKTGQGISDLFNGLLRRLLAMPVTEELRTLRERSPP
jgi:small GTP-binding protein